MQVNQYSSSSHSDGLIVQTMDDGKPGDVHERFTHHGNDSTTRVAVGGVSLCRASLCDPSIDRMVLV